MKNALLLFCFLCFPFLLISQFHTSLDLVGSYDLKNQISYAFNTGFPSGNNRSSYRFGANFNFKVFNQVFIKTGIRYVKQVYKTVESSFFDGSYYREYIDEYYFEVPIVYRYEFSEKKFSLFTEIGFSPHFFLKGKNVVESDMGNETIDYEILYLKDRRVRIGFNLGVGMNYKIRKSLQLFLQPTFRYYPRVGTQAYPLLGTINYGVEFGIRHVLRYE